MKQLSIQKFQKKDKLDDLYRKDCMHFKSSPIAVFVNVQKRISVNGQNLPKDGNHKGKSTFDGVFITTQYDVRFTTQDVRTFSLQYSWFSV